MLLRTVGIVASDVDSCLSRLRCKDARRVHPLSRAGFVEEDQRLRLHSRAVPTFRRMMFEERALRRCCNILGLSGPIFWVPTSIGHLRFVFWYLSFVIPFLISSSHWSSEKHEDERKD
jgi:hypothetical protein